MLIVERVRAEDTGAVTHLAMRSLKERYDPAWLSEHAHLEEGAFLVARDVPTNNVVGFALAERADGAEGHLLALAVDASHQNQGIGSALLRGVRENLARTGAMNLRLDVRADDLRARQFYLAHGFLPVGLEEHVYSDGADAVVMQRPI